MSWNFPTVTHEEWCARIGIPYNNAQREARQALYDFESKYGRYGIESDTWADDVHNEYQIRSLRITVVDALRVIEARQNGWLGYPAALENQAKQRRSKL